MRGAEGNPLTAPLVLTRSQILAFRRRVGALDARLPPGRESLRRAAWAGLQDSMPRAAVLSVYARVEHTGPSVWEDPAFVQLWGPRYSVYVVPARDRAVFSLSRLPDDAQGRHRAESLAARVRDHLDGAKRRYDDVGRALGVRSNSLRYATTTGTLALRWDGARQPIIWTLPRPEVDPRDARHELVRRYLHVFGPSTPVAFAEWAGISQRATVAAFSSLSRSLIAVRTPVGALRDAVEAEAAAMPLAGIEGRIRVAWTGAHRP